MKSTSAVRSFSAIAGGCLLTASGSVLAGTPTTFDLLSWGVVLAISLAGGLLVWIPRYLDNDAAKHQALRLTGDLLGSLFAGILTYYICALREMDWLLTVPTIGLSALGGVGGVKLIRRLMNGAPGK